MKMFSSLYSRFIKGLVALNRFNKNLLVMTADYLMLVLSFWLSLSIRINEVYIPTQQTYLLILLAPLLAIPVFYFFGLYKSLIRYSSYQSLLWIMLAAFVYTFCWFLIVLFSDMVIKPYDFLIINLLLSIFFVGGIRYLARWFLVFKDNTVPKVLIYGAGSAGLELRSAIWHSNEINIIAFLDDDHLLQGRIIDGLKVYAPEQLEKLIKNKGISEIIIAIPKAKRSRIQEILKSLKRFSIMIRVLPSVSDMAKGRVSISDLKIINIEDLLGREIRTPDSRLLNQNIKEKNIMVTGAGGSIGSELCRQIIRLQPRLLMLFDSSEYSLYKIEQELLEIASDVRLITIIGNVTRNSRLEKAMKKFQIQTVYHAAAYKHVPMVQKNISAGLRVNIFGTLACIKAAIAAEVESFVFISTDKAVRPTNIMGASKRFAELILQAFALKQINDEAKEKIQISMVRFGNVLASSGSVVPLFREQIEKGGPITVTDPNIVRYFMTITEAAQLVIQAGAMGSDGDIFVLDMGQPVEVLNLAKDMIKLSGMTIKDEQHPEGDIEIIFTGLRPGEKLFEELLIEDVNSSTQHPMIMKAEDKGLIWSRVEHDLSLLEKALEEDDYQKINEIFEESVDGFVSRREINDPLFQ